MQHRGGMRRYPIEFYKIKNKTYQNSEEITRQDLAQYQLIGDLALATARASSSLRLGSDQDYRITDHRLDLLSSSSLVFLCHELVISTIGFACTSCFPLLLVTVILSSVDFMFVLKHL